MEKSSYAYYELKKKVTDSLKNIRHTIIIPYLKENVDTKTCGLFIGPYESVAELFPDELSDESFPLDTRNELIVQFDASRRAILEDEEICSKHPILAKEKRIEAYFERRDELIIPYSNWRGDCSRYLKAITMNPSKAATKFLEDENPYILYGAITSVALLRGRQEEINCILREYTEMFSIWAKANA